MCVSYFVSEKINEIDFSSTELRVQIIVLKTPFVRLFGCSSVCLLSYILCL